MNLYNNHLSNSSEFNYNSLEQVEKDFIPSYVGLRKDIISMISNWDGYSVLDVGCSTGVNGKFLKEKFAIERLVGFEYDPDMAKVAEDTYDNIYTGDIESLDLKELLAGEQFDAVILGDILEHLKQPEAVLAQLAQFVKSGGSVIISVPNMRHISALIALFVNGYWPRNERGIFDRTHLQVVTRKNLTEWITGADLNLVEIKRKFRYRDAIGSRFPVWGFLLKRLFPELYTFQLLALAKKSN